MKDKDNGVIFLKDWGLLITPMSAENQLVFWSLFTNYEYGKDQPCENPYVAPVWNFVKSQLDNMRTKYKENIVERNRENGARGGRPKKETKETQRDTKQPNPTEENLKNPVGFLETQKTPNNNNKDNNNEKDNVNHFLLKKETKEENLPKENLEALFVIPPELEERKKVPRKKERRVFTKVDFKNRLIELGADEIDADKWIEVRKQKRAVFTEDAIQLVINECEKYNFSFSEAIKASGRYGWQGFEYEWYLNKQKNNNLQSNGHGNREINRNAQK